MLQRYCCDGMRVMVVVVEVEFYEKNDKNFKVRIYHARINE